MPTNRLAQEKSPYLLQHAHNPVDWHPWSDEAFKKAGREDKPVFLSVGYATCHWCHVMERESFEDEEAAGYLNDAFVCIKVDREERPDIDAVYMAVCNMITGSGGWPLTIIMTPDKKPFFAATYLPKNNRFGRMGLVEVSRQVKKLWREDRARVVESARSIGNQMGQAFRFSPDSGGLNREALDQAHTHLEKTFDARFAGFDTAPKFPTPHRLLFLLRRYHDTRDEKALAMVEATLGAMRMGGIWDHVGLGVHRYATDREWLPPHFEKMLYDQALTALAFLEAYQITRNSFYARTAEEIFTYVLRDMTSAEGAFFAAEDADSEGEEGKFYVWTVDELKAVLGDEEGGVWERVFNFASDGNFTDEASRQKTGANIPHLKKPLSEWAREFNMPADKLQDQWEAARERLFKVREKRIHPLKDDKVLTDWNGLMIAALALGARVLDRPEYARAARHAVRFIRDRLYDGKGRLLHRYRDGEAAIDAHADDYAYLIMGLLELYAAEFDPLHLRLAVKLQREMNERFWDDLNGGFYKTAADNTDLPVRPKEIYDGALPSANSVAFSNLLGLERLTGESRWAEKADELMRAFAGTIQRQPSIFTQFLCGLDFALGAGKEVVLAGEPDAADTREMMAALNATYAPHARVILKTPGNAAALAELAPFTKGLETVDGKATALICSNFICKEPTTDMPTLLARIKGGL